MSPRSRSRSGSANSSGGIAGTDPRLSVPPRSSVASSYKGTPTVTPPPYNPARSFSASRQRTPSPQQASKSRSTSITGNGTALHPWNCADEMELLPTRTVQMPNIPAKTPARDRRSSTTSDEEYDRYGFSHRPPKEDAYQRYLQQKVEKTVPTSRSSSASSNMVRSRSPSVEPFYSKRQPPESDRDEEEEKKSAAASAKELRARRLATQKTSVARETDLRLQSHNPAVQAYLARKEKERAQQQRTASASPSRYTHNPPTEELEIVPSLIYQRRQQRLEQPKRPGRPPAFQAKSSTTSASGGATNTNQSQPDHHQRSHSSDIPQETTTSVTRARRLLQSSSLSNSRSASSPRPALAWDSPPDELITSSTYTRTLSDTPKKTANEKQPRIKAAQIGPSSQNSPSLTARDARTGMTVAPPRVLDPPQIQRKSSCQDGPTTIATKATPTSHSRAGSETSIATPNATHSRTNSDSCSSSAAGDCSVARAKRLLQEGKERENMGSTPLPATSKMPMPTTSATDKPPPIATATSAASSSSSSLSSAPPRSSQSSASQNNNNSNDIHKNQGIYNTSVPSIPRPLALQTIPSDLENDNWSVRVCVISAVDFPVHVVPNMPLSPVLKLGLVSIPSTEASATGKDRLLRDIDRRGLGAVSEQMRCTTTKLLSKRDNGAVEFHEELRWDHVALKPAANENLALAVELCARGVLRPANLQESPPPHVVATKPASGFSPLNIISREVTPSPGARRSPEPADFNASSQGTAAAADGAAPMRPGGRIVNMFRKSASRNKGRIDSAMESAQAAAAVAKLLVQGSTSPLMSAKDVTSGTTIAVQPPPPPITGGARNTSTSQTGVQAPQEWDVTLRRSSESSSPTSGSSAGSPVTMTDDIRLGSLLIPLTELEDLARTLQDRSKPARLEKWFEVQNMNNAIMSMSTSDNPMASNPARWLSRDRDGAGGNTRSQSPANAANSRTRRNPSILLELSLYAPEVLDESEDEMDEEDVETEMDGSLSRQLVTLPKSFAKRTTVQVRYQLAMQNKNAAANAASSKSPQKDSREEEKENARAANQDPYLKPGIIDFISVVGARDIGDQKQDDGSKGWVLSTPECCVLEQFPPTDDFHIQQNRDRTVLMPQKVEWFCFPDGVKLWRGTEPPSASDFLSQQQQQQSSAIMTPSQIMVSEAESTSLALFDAYLNCTTSFNWFVIASNSDEYGSSLAKTYGAVIRFYVPAPRGIDPTQDDFAQTLMSGPDGPEEDGEESWLDQKQSEQAEDTSRGPVGTGRQKKETKRLWVPIGICVTSSLPIIGVMEAVLMRSCEMLASRPKIVAHTKNKINNMIQRHLANLILNFQQPLAGAVNTSVPFLLGEALQVRLPSKAGLPALPHGNSVASVCRLLGPEGFIFVLAALLTESKILLHSHNPANCAMVAEVMTALLYPFNWSLPYVPVLPVGMLEFIEAPLSYLLGIPSSCLEQNLVDPAVLEDVVVVDLDNGFSSPDWKTTTTKYRAPTPLPSLVASNISRAVYRLLRALENEHDFGEKHGQPVSNASDRLSRIQPESKAEREFRIAIALEMGGLVRGYQDCLVFVSTSQPVFNREKFLKRAPALFIEEPSGGSSAMGSRANKVKPNRRILSSRSKRFLSILVNCQHFHQFLETLRNEECAFFHEVMEMWIKGDETPNKSSDVSVFENSSSFDHTRAIAKLSKGLLALEEKISVFDVAQPHSNKPSGLLPEDDILNDEDYQILSRDQRFPRNLLLQIDVGSGDSDKDEINASSKSSQQKGVASLSLQYLVELEKNPWRYKKVLDISVAKVVEETTPVKEVIAGDQSVLIQERVKLRDAIGDRKFRAWKLSREQLGDEGEHSNNSFEDALINPGDFGTTLDLASLMTSTTEDTFSETSSQLSLTNHSMGSRGATNSRSNLPLEQQRVANAKDRDVLRRCLEKAYAAKPNQQGEQDLAEVFSHHGRDLVSEAEVALRNPSAQHFLLSLLSKRSTLEADAKQKQMETKQLSSHRPGNANPASSSRLEPIAFECVVRLCCAMLDSCMEAKDYEPAYLLLCHTAGLFTVQRIKRPDNEEVEGDDEYQQTFLTARIGLHPLFADLGLWQKVMSLHLAEKHANMNASDRIGSDKVGNDPLSSVPFAHSESFENDIQTISGDDEKEYEAAVATLYDMLGYGIPAEELARFANKVSREYGWFSSGSERGQSLLLLARRLSMRRELSVMGGVAPGETGDLDILQVKSKSESFDRRESGLAVGELEADEDDNFETLDIGWCHPAAPALQGRDASGRTAITSLFRGGGQQVEYMNRSAVTALATFSPSVVVSGGLDGGVFLAHTAPRLIEEEAGSSTFAHPNVVVRGIHLDWGSSGSRAMPGSTASSSADGEYGVGAVSCLAAATGAGGQQYQASHAKDVLGLKDEEDMIKEMEDCRVIAGTTCGDLKIWSVKDVYAAIHLAQCGEDPFGIIDAGRVVHASEGTSSYIPSTPTRRRLGGTTTDSAGSNSGNNPFNRLKFSLRGRALSGHRGGVTCIDVPSHVYRPDSVVTGGADGLIKLWSLRTSTVGRRGSDTSTFIAASTTAVGQLGRRLSSNRGGDALGVLNGHGGRVLCVKTAWHGDRLLSGGADRTIRIWDIMSGGKGAGASSSSGGDAACLHTLSGHFGWVTHVQYWGPNTIVSGSTDRSIALWDARVRNSPLFVLRHHHAPISDLLVGSRTNPLMVSAASDGSVTTWDFRLLSGSAQSEASGSSIHDSSDHQQSGKKQCKVVRHPTAVMSLGESQAKFSLAKAGPTILARGDCRATNTVLSAGSDAVMREWDVASGQLVNQWNSGHCDALSSLTSLAQASSNNVFGVTSDSDGTTTGTITSSWDGTIRMRKRIPKGHAI